MWTAVKIGAIISAVLLTLAFIGILIMVTRPALLSGVSSDSLAHSLDGPNYGDCRKLEDDNWECSSPEGLTHRVEVDWLGCWKVVETQRQDDRVALTEPESGCIELEDIVRIN